MFSVRFGYPGEALEKNFTVSAGKDYDVFGKASKCFTKEPVMFYRRDQKDFFYTRKRPEKEAPEASFSHQTDCFYRSFSLYKWILKKGLRNYFVQLFIRLPFI
jgi:hypothetical protein